MASRELDLSIQPDRILAAMGDADIVSVCFRCDSPPVYSRDNDYLRVQGLLSQPAVYQAFDVMSMSLSFDFRKLIGFEVLGALANLLAEGGRHGPFVDSPAEAFAEAKTFVDAIVSNDYSTVEGYVISEGWCAWFCNESMLDTTLLIGKGGAWWLLAVTWTD